MHPASTNLFSGPWMMRAIFIERCKIDRKARKPFPWVVYEFVDLFFLAAGFSSAITILGIWLSRACALPRLTFIFICTGYYWIPIIRDAGIVILLHGDDTPSPLYVLSLSLSFFFFTFTLSLLAAATKLSAGAATFDFALPDSSSTSNSWGEKSFSIVVGLTFPRSCPVFT